MRGVSVFPNQVVSVLGQHEEDEMFPVQGLSVSHCKNFLASCSHDNSIKFYDIADFVKGRADPALGEFVDDSDSESMEVEGQPRKLQPKAGLEEEDDDDDDDSDDNEEGEEVDFTDSDEEEEGREIKKGRDKKMKPIRMKKMSEKRRKNEVQKERRSHFFQDM